jgi:hypothetical protein
MIVLLLIQRNVGGHIYVFYISDNQLGICRRTSNNGHNFRYGLHSHLRSQSVDTDWVVAELCRELLGQLPWPAKYCKSLWSEKAVWAVHLGQMPRCMHMQRLLRCRLPIAV